MVIQYHAAQFSDPLVLLPLVLLPKLGYVYIKSDKANMGYYILQSSKDICFMLHETTTHESRVFCVQYAGMTVLHIDLRGGSFLVSQQPDVDGKKMWAVLVKLQWWFRLSLHKYKVTRRAALAMCLHKRLGNRACLSSSSPWAGADAAFVVWIVIKTKYTKSRVSSSSFLLLNCTRYSHNPLPPLLLRML